MEYTREQAGLLLKNKDSGIIDVDIDDLTSCLRRIETGQLVQTTVEKIDTQRSDLSGWFYPWDDEVKCNPTGVYGLRVNGDIQLQGLISIKAQRSGAEVRFVESMNYQKRAIKKYEGIGGHLFAEAVKQSREAGNPEGFIYFRAKTELIHYYQEKLGAVCGYGNQMGIFGQAARNLFERYYGRWDDWKPGN